MWPFQNLKVAFKFHSIFQFKFILVCLASTEANKFDRQKIENISISLSTENNVLLFQRQINKFVLMHFFEPAISRNLLVHSYFPSETCEACTWTTQPPPVWPDGQMCNSIFGFITTIKCAKYQWETGQGKFNIRPNAKLALQFGCKCIIFCHYGKIMPNLVTLAATTTFPSIAFKDFFELIMVWVRMIVEHPPQKKRQISEEIVFLKTHFWTWL